MCLQKLSSCTWLSLNWMASPGWFQGKFQTALQLFKAEHKDNQLIEQLSIYCICIYYRIPNHIIKKHEKSRYILSLDFFIIIIILEALNVLHLHSAISPSKTLYSIYTQECFPPLKYSHLTISSTIFKAPAIWHWKYSSVCCLLR